MSKSVTMVIGLPGSGKSHFLDHIKTTYPESIVIDDIGSPEELPDDFTGNLYISSPIFCKTWKSVSKKVHHKYPGTIVRLRFFENDPDAAIRNVKYRNDGRSVSDLYIRFLSSQYEIPERIHTLPIWNPVID